MMIVPLVGGTLLNYIVANAAQYVPIDAPTLSEFTRISCSRISLDSLGERLLALEIWRLSISHLSPVQRQVSFCQQAGAHGYVF